MSDINIRKATLDDLGQLLTFEQGIIKTERPFDPTLKPDPISYYDLKTMLTDPDVEIVVVEIEKKIVASGYALIRKSQSFLKHNNHAYLGFMYVLPEYRGKGINKLIVDSLKKWAESKNVFELRLEVYFDNISAIKAYEKFGFKSHMIEMRYNSNEQ